MILLSSIYFIIISNLNEGTNTVLDLPIESLVLIKSKHFGDLLDSKRVIEVNVFVEPLFGGIFLV